MRNVSAHAGIRIAAGAVIALGALSATPASAAPAGKQIVQMSTYRCLDAPSCNGGTYQQWSPFG
ncbi:hypothetical protein [Streptomyces clavifer]|uniref:hypothetical protein n=1 Tax=Streptomyces clavifer TaxID=68188 RepID=UPI00365AFA58